jgi:hypothetical protein
MGGALRQFELGFGPVVEIVRIVTHRDTFL